MSFPHTLSKKRKSTDSLESTVSLDNSESAQGESITLPFGRCSKSYRHCLICKSQKSMVNVPAEAKMQVFIKRGLIVQGNTRCCQIYLTGKIFNDSAEN